MSSTAEKLADFLSARPEVELAVLFGSAARGELRPNSDVDIGLRTNGIDRASRLRLEGDLERLVQRTCDFTVLDEAPPQLRFEIARDGVVLVQRHPGDWTAFRARAFVDWWDFAPIARRIDEAAIAQPSE